MAPGQLRLRDNDGVNEGRCQSLQFFSPRLVTVINNSVGRLIDVNMNVVGEEFNAKSSYAIQADYYSDSDLDGKSIFVDAI